MPQPQTVNEAIDFIYQSLNADDIKFIKKNDSGSVHFSAGMRIRNDMGLWKKKSPIVKDFKQRFKLFGHGDDISSIILEGVWLKVKKDTNIDLKLQQKAACLRGHWITEGINPDTGKTTGEEPVQYNFQTIEIKKDADGHYKTERIK